METDFIGYHGTSFETWKIAQETGFMPGSTAKSVFEHLRGELYFYPRLEYFPDDLRNKWIEEIDLLDETTRLKQTLEAAKAVAVRHKLLSLLALDIEQYDGHAMEILDYYGRPDYKQEWEMFYKTGLTKKQLEDALTKCRDANGLLLGITRSVVTDILIGGGNDGDDLKLMPGFQGTPIRYFRPVQ